MTAAAKTVLVVDDEEDLCELLCSSLSSGGFDCQIAPDGAEAWRIFEEMTFDAVLTDFHMPKLSGIELVKKVKEKAPLTFCVIMMTDATEEEVAEVKANGVDFIISKPFDLDEVDKLFFEFKSGNFKAV